MPGVPAVALASGAFPRDTPKMSPGQEPCRDPGTGTAPLQGGPPGGGERQSVNPGEAHHLKARQCSAETRYWRGRPSGQSVGTLVPSP